MTTKRDVQDQRRAAARARQKARRALRQFEARAERDSERAAWAALLPTMVSGSHGAEIRKVRASSAEWRGERGRSW